MPPAAGRCFPATSARRPPPPRTATATPPPMSSRSPDGSAATRAGTWPSPPARPDQTSWTSTITARPGTDIAAFATLSEAGLLDGAAVYVRTPSGGLHAYFRGSDQRNGHLPAHHLDFRSRGGYVLAPPSLVDGKPYQLIRTVEADGGLDWAEVTGLLEPQRQIARPQPRPAPDRDLSHLARWVASQQRRQPQRGPVLGRQPRPGSRPGRRPQPPGRRRPPGRPGRQGDHPHPGLRPQNRPARPPPARSPSRGRELT